MWEMVFSFCHVGPKVELGLVIKLDSKCLYLMHPLVGSPGHSDARQAPEAMAMCTNVIVGIQFGWGFCCLVFSFAFVFFLFYYLYIYWILEFQVQEI